MPQYSALNLIHIDVRLFGPSADWVGRDELQYELQPDTALSTLIELLVAKYPRFGEKVPYLRFAVNGEYADASQALKEGDEVAVIPPVAGGEPEPVRLTRDAIRTTDLVALVADPSCGGIVTFEGVVRSEGPPENPLLALEYSAYEDMARQQMRRIRDQARQSFAIHEAIIVHRLGRLAIGECSIAIVVSAPHRDAAFGACRWIIETIKKDVPIWKKEVWRNGPSSWVELIDESKSKVESRKSKSEGSEI